MFLGFLTVIGGITALGRLFDAIDKLIPFRHKVFVKADPEEIVIVIGIAEHIFIAHEADRRTVGCDLFLERIDHYAHLLGSDLHLHERDRDIFPKELRVDATRDDQFTASLFQFFTELYDCVGMGVLYTYDIE